MCLFDRYTNFKRAAKYWYQQECTWLAFYFCFELGMLLLVGVATNFEYKLPASGIF